MQHRRFGRLGWQVSEIGYGMWGMGGWTGSDDAESREIARSRRGARVQLLRHRVRVRHGKSEKLLGAMLRRHAGKRLYIATKVPAKNMKWPGSADVPAADTYPYQHIIEYTQKSLENLGADARGPSAAARVERRMGR